MTKRKHSQGKWVNDTGNVYFSHMGRHLTVELIIADRYTEQEVWVAAVLRDQVGMDTQAANSRLIASSPRMYEYIRAEAKKGDIEAQRIISDIDTVPQETQREKRLISQRLRRLLKKMRKEKAEKDLQSP